MLRKLEKFINIGIGITIINNLYYFSGIFGLSSSIIIIICLLLSLLFFLLNFNKDQIVNFINSWNTIFFVTTSIPLCFIDWFINGSVPIANDLIRVLLYFFYFSWTFSINNKKPELNKWFIHISLLSIIILTIQGLFENANPLLFSIILSDNIEKRVLTRIAGTLIDSNSYSGAICIYFLILSYELNLKNKGLQKVLLVIIFLLALYLTDLAGSRQGLIMLFSYVFYLLLKNITFFKTIIIGVTVIVTLFSAVIFSDQLTNYARENPSSSIARLLKSEENERSLQSNLDRKHSLTDGLNLCVDNYFIYGPGALNFSSRWISFTNAHEPHNGLLFILVQYGILSIIPFYLLFLLAKRAFKNHLLIFFLIFLIHYLLQPNLMYYAITFLFMFYIDTKHYFNRNSI
ncbi:MAG: hypothetical protein V4538_09265 [Bacteroidota bacterium]